MEGEESIDFGEILRARRSEIFERSLGLESGWRSLLERDAELEEEAQKANLMSLYDQLAFRDRNEIEEIDRALLKLEEGSFGRCERCKRPISLRRLEALPESRFCLSCARRLEGRSSRPNSNRKVISCSAAPSGYEHLSDEDLTGVVLEALQDDGRVNLEELEVTCRKGKIQLDGVLSTQEEHQIVLRILLDLVCSGTIVDRVEIAEVRSGEEEDMPDEYEGESKMGIPLEMDEEEMTDDPFEMEEEDTLFDFPDRPPAEKFE